MEPPTVTALDERRCVDCVRPGQFPVVDRAGRFHGWICKVCDRRARRRRRGFWRSLGRRM